MPTVGACADPGCPGPATRKADTWPCGFGSIAGVLAASALLVACSSSSGTATGSTQATGGSADGGAPGATTPDGASGGTSSGDCALGGTTVPDGQWNGPLTFSTEGTSSEASGSVLSTGGGELDLVVSGGQVTGTTWAMDVSSTGQMTIQSTTADIDGHLVVQGGTVSGTAGAVTLQGSGQLSGTLTVHSGGANIPTPLDGVFPTTADLTIVSVSCDQVVATMIPSLEQQGGGRSTFTGVAHWTGRPA